MIHNNQALNRRLLLLKVAERKKRKTRLENYKKKVTSMNVCMLFWHRTDVDLLLLLVEDVNREEESDDEDPLKRDDELKEIVDEYFGKESELGEGEKFLSYYFLKPMCKEEDGKTKTQVIDEAEIELFEKNEDLVFGMDGNCKSTKGISMAVVDAYAVMNEQSVTDLAENFVTVPEVLSEIRDAQHRLKFISFTIETMEPSPESLSRFIKFAKAIGDLHTLSDVDLKLIALTHTFEAEVHGIKNLRDVPPPIQIVRVKRLPEKELPGLGFHVANLEEREALGNGTEEKSNTTAKILLLQDTNMNIIPSENCYEASSVASHTVDEEEEGGRRQKRYPPKKTEVKLEGNMVVEGLYTSQGENDEEDGGKWRHAVSSSTHKYLFRRRTKWEHYNALAEQEIQKDQKADKAGYFTQDTNDQMSNDSKGKCSEKNDEELSSILKDMRLEEDSLKALQEGTEETNFSNGENDIEVEAEGIDVANVANTVRGFSFRFGVATKIIEACADNEQIQLFVGNMGFSGVSISMLRKKKISTGQCVCLIDDYGNRTMRPCLSSGVKILADELIKADFTGFKWLVLRYAVLNLEVIKVAIGFAKQEGLSVSLDLASLKMAPYIEKDWELNKYKVEKKLKFKMCSSLRERMLKISLKKACGASYSKDIRNVKEI
ncbi:RNA-binding NOB1-like protein [Brassica napus]|nr:RNA-binding NOB1-like protein [Brassica napus]